VIATVFCRWHCSSTRCCARSTGTVIVLLTECMQALVELGAVLGDLFGEGGDDLL
jgi:hypothetical protein